MRVFVYFLFIFVFSGSLMALRAQTIETYPEDLLTETELLPGWPMTDGTLLLEKRGFVVCRGKNFRDDPPVRPGAEIRIGQQKYPGLAQLNNQVIEQIKTLGIDDKGELAKATELLEQGLVFDNEFLPILMNLGRLYLVQKKYAKSEAYFNRALRLLPDFALIHWQIGLVYSLQKNDFKARYHLKRAIELEPTHTRARVTYGEHLQSLGSLSHARSVYAQVLRDHPESLAAFLALQRLEIHLGKHNQVRRDLMDYIADNPDREFQSHPEVLYMLAELNYTLRDPKRAKSYYQLLLEKNEDAFFLFHSRKSLQKRLNSINKLK